MEQRVCPLCDGFVIVDTEKSLVSCERCKYEMEMDLSSSNATTSFWRWAGNSAQDDHIQKIAERALAANAEEQTKIIGDLLPINAIKLWLTLDKMNPMKSVSAAEYYKKQYEASVTSHTSDAMASHMADYYDNEVRADRGGVFEVPDDDTLAEINKVKQALRQRFH